MLRLTEELIGTTGYLTLWARCYINRCRYKRVFLTEEYNVTVDRGINWYHRISDVISGVSYKPVLL